METQKKYDIFISYRTSDTAEKAELLSTLLEHKYPNQISYDKDNLEGLWDVELARRIDGCTDVIVLIGENSFQELDSSEECVELYDFFAKATLSEVENKLISLGRDYKIDFFRLEIARALHVGANIVPIILYDDTCFNLQGLSLPKDLQRLKKWQAVSYHNHKNNTSPFKIILPSIESKLKTRSNVEREQNDEEYVSLFKLYADKDCSVYSGCIKIADIRAYDDEPKEWPVKRRGEYRFRFEPHDNKKTKIRDEKIGENEEKIVHEKFKRIDNVGNKILIGVCTLFIVFSIMTIVIAKPMAIPPKSSSSNMQNEVQKHKIENIQDKPIQSPLIQE